MNILFILGNGFDINLGLKTRYPEFFEYYQSAYSDNEYVQRLKKLISNDSDTWADLELALGNYTEHIQTLEEFDAIYANLCTELSTYLGKQEQILDYSKANIEKFYSDLTHPETYLRPTESAEVKTFKEQWLTNHWNINIITLNYTRVIEKILNDDTLDKKILRHHNSYEVVLKNLLHIHGYLDDRMIIGVNDASQIKNKTFHDSLEIQEALIKISNNQASKEFTHSNCEFLVNSANLICIFGSSIGDTDKHWWNLIGNQLKNNCRLLLFSKTEEINKLFRSKIERPVRQTREYFLSKTDLTNEEKETIKPKIYIGINTSIFTNLFI